MSCWDRAIIHVDMNAFFASVEQRDYPQLKGRPIGVTNGLTGTCVITSSYEARAHGVRTGMRVRQAKQICPGFIQRPARPEVYAQTSTTIMESFLNITPDVEVFSCDEAFLDITKVQKLHGGDPVAIARKVKQHVYTVSGVKCSLGLSGDKTTSKYAAKLEKPDGFTVIEPWNAARELAGAPVTDLCGVNKGIGRFLADYGVFTCGDMRKIPVSVLGRRFGNPGRRIWLMAQGADPEPVKLEVCAPKSIAHGKVMPPNTTDKARIIMYLEHMSCKVGARLRKNDLEASVFLFGIRTPDNERGWLSAKYRHNPATQDTKVIISLAMRFFDTSYRNHACWQVLINALDPKPARRQIDLFTGYSEKQDSLCTAMDKINEKYGEFTVAPSRLINRSDMPNVISPAWKPNSVAGHRQTIL